MTAGSLHPEPARLRIPAHVAIIMDGNGRWARARGLPRVAGHREGAEAISRTLRAAGEMGISYLTLFGFSSENWKRPADEIQDLMGLLRRYLQSEVAELQENGVRLRVIGDRSTLAPDIVSMIVGAEDRTRHNDAINLTVALSYGGRQELVAAVRSLGREFLAGRLRPEEIDERIVSNHLTTAEIPDPDLLIRTSGEQRLSNFLLWQCAYTELIFLDVLWPDFGADHLTGAVTEFSQRERRYGAYGG